VVYRCYYYVSFILRFKILMAMVRKGQIKGKAVPVTGRKGPQECERSRIPHLLDNRLTDGGKVVSLTRGAPFTPREFSWYSFLLEAVSTRGHSAAGRIR
jgi:hypothetical protein